MNISARSILTAGITTITATAIVVAPSVAPPPPTSEHRTVELAAQTRPLVDKPFAALVAAAQQQSQERAAAAPLVGDQPTTAALIAFPGVSQAIKNIYNFGEYWVSYGVEWAVYAVGWIPFGYLIGDEINIFYYNLEPIAQSIVYNIADFIGGSVSFVQGVRNVIRDSADAGINLVNAEIAWAWNLVPNPFPPPRIPNLPWFGVLQTSASEVTAKGAAVVEQDVEAKPKGPIGAITKVVGELTKGLIPEKALPTETTIDEVEGVEETGQEAVDDGTPARPARPLLTASRSLTKALVRAQGDVRGAIADATDGVPSAVKPRDRGAVRDALASAPKTIAKGLRDSSRRVEGSIQKVVGGIKKATDEARAARAERKAETKPSEKASTP